MKKYYIVVSSILLSFFTHAQEYAYPFSVFTNSRMNSDYFFSSTHSSGEAMVKNIKGKLPVVSDIYHTPGNALLLQYKNSSNGDWQAKIFKDEKRGIDNYKKATHLSFWIFAKDVSKNDLYVKLMKADSSETNAVAISITAMKSWQQIKIPIETFKNTSAGDLSRIIGVVFSGKSENGKTQSVYIDDIECIDATENQDISTKPVINSASDKYVAHIDLLWDKIIDPNIRMIKIYRSEDKKNYKPLGVQEAYLNRYTDFVGADGKKYYYKISFLNKNYEETTLSPAISGTIKKVNDEELLTMVQEASFRYYWEQSEEASGLAKENFPGRQNMIAIGASGFGMMALLAGVERNFITRKQATARFLKIVSFLEKADRFHGVFPHFLDGPSGKVEPYFGKHDNGADLVETAFLMQGLLCAKQYFSKNNLEEQIIRDKIELIWKQTEWSWFRQTQDSKFLYWHWSPNQAWVINHPLIGWNETMVVYLLAIASPTYSVLASMYYSGWANQDSIGIKYRSGWSQTLDGSLYTNGKTYNGIKLEVGVSNGGTLFFTHYSFMGYDPHMLTDKYINYFKNNRNIALINYDYCVQNPKGYKGYGDSSWGLTASDGPFRYSADEPVLWQDWGKITPTGAISSFPYTPVQSMKALKNFYFNKGEFLWGEYGFRDAFDLSQNWCSGIFMGLNQAPMVVMIENYRTGMLWKLFMKNPDIQNGLRKLELESSQQNY